MGLAEATLDKGDTLLYEELTELIIRVSDYVTRAYEALQKKVRAAMGGEVLELLNDRAKRLEHEAEDRGLALGLQQGMEQGLQQGMEQGIEQGMEQGASDLANLLKGLGIEEEILDQAIEALRENRKQPVSVEEE